MNVDRENSKFTLVLALSPPLLLVSQRSSLHFENRNTPPL